MESKETVENNEELNINKKKTKNETEREDINRTEKTDSNINETKKDENEKETKKEEIKKEKVPIVPYKIGDSSYQEKLLTALRKQNKLRPKYLFSQDFEDITENITELEKKEQSKDEKEEEEDFRAMDVDKEEKIALNRYKESSFSGTTILQDPYALFAGAEQVYIDQYYKISDLFVICPIYFNYRISLEYRVSQENDEQQKFEAYHLFTTKEITPACSHNFLPNQSRQIDINIFNYIVEPKEKEMQKFITIRKPCRCAFSCFCACCTRPIFEVVTPIETLGKIIEIRTLCDPVLHVLDVNDNIIYIISTKCCQCGYFLRDSFCDNRKCARCMFIISDKNNNGIGKIFKDHRSGKRIQPDYDQMVITYPAEASCQEKILILCASLSIEYLYFQNMTNIKRCNGIPKYLNTPPY